MHIPLVAIVWLCWVVGALETGCVGFSGLP